ncbi:hypothetical protein BA763_24055 [Burkholderia cenocepacia]|nr:hypothetical protein BA763_24055 [Burkholderia cenocepacia]
MADSISDEELFELWLNNFLKWLEALTMEPVELCDTWGNYNVAWELVSDLNTAGSFIVAVKCGYLTERQKTRDSRFSR